MVLHVHSDTPWTIYLGFPSTALQTDDDNSTGTHYSRVYLNQWNLHVAKTWHVCIPLSCCIKPTFKESTRLAYSPIENTPNLLKMLNQNKAQSTMWTSVLYHDVAIPMLTDSLKLLSLCRKSCICCECHVCTMRMGMKLQEALEELTFLIETIVNVFVWSFFSWEYSVKWQWIFKKLRPRSIIWLWLAHVEARIPPLLMTVNPTFL